MRIIDKNKDFYDYMQYKYFDDTFTFDRTNSYIMTKEDIISYLPLSIRGTKKPYYVLLQICHTFWLFELTVAFSDTCYKPIDYSLSLFATWSNFNSKREMLKLSSIEFRWGVKPNDYIYLIDTNDYNEHHIYNKFYIYKGNDKEERNIPILKDIGIASVVNAFDIYNALEMYFSEEKTANERTEAIGATNDDKIVAHGFDTKTSFRK